METKKLNKVYLLYESGKYNEAKELNDQILKNDPNNIYANRYISLLSSKIEKKEKSEIPKVKGKQLKCPHCLSKISITGLSDVQQNKIKNGEYSNLELKCPYCHTNFLLQRKTAKSIIGIKIGDKAELGGKMYRVTGYIEYKGKWIEESYSGRLEYLEWILLGENNSYKYFSEGFSIDEGKKTYEFEFSSKYIPDGKVNINSYKEKNILKVNSIYGENSKSFKIGESIEILDFGNYILEKEGSGSQLEVGFYKGKEVSQYEALKIFGKVDNTGISENNNIFPKIIGFSIVGIISTFLIFKPLFLSFENKEIIDINEINKGDKFEVLYGNGEGVKITSTKRYDYGGIKTYYEQKQGIKFSIQTDDDLKIIEKVKGERLNSDIQKIKEGKIYQIK